MTTPYSSALPSIFAPASLRQCNTPDDVQAAIPSEFARFYPRKYAAPGGYTSPRLPAAFLAMTKAPNLHGPGKSFFRASEPVADFLESLNMPTYWVGKELLLAAEKTMPPEDLCANDLLLPLNGMIFLLPHGTLTNDDGVDLSWFTIAKYRVDEGDVEGLIFLTSNLSLHIRFNILRDYQISCAEGGAFERSLYEKLGVNGGRFGRKLLKLAINLIMLMSARPELIETPTPADRAIPTTGKAARKLCSPNWIGRTYRIHREVPLGGTHASPSLHWRRGHLRWQPHGKGRTLQKRIWLDPVLVGSGE